MTLLHTFDPDLISSGKMEFTVAAGGQVKNPALRARCSSTRSISRWMACRMG